MLTSIGGAAAAGFRKPEVSPSASPRGRLRADLFSGLLPRQLLLIEPRGIRPPAGGVGGAGTTAFSLDRCPRCPTFNAVSAGPAMTAGDALKMWAVFKATELARADLYFEFALDAARARRLAVAREVALETVGHVTMEDPRPHFPLGQLGVGLGTTGWCGRRGRSSGSRNCVTGSGSSTKSRVPARRTSTASRAGLLILLIR